MTIPETQAEVVAFLRKILGNTPLLKETHISIVLIGQDTVFKVKKAVRLSFLDFSEISARKHFIFREFELNRQAAPGLYRDVVAVVRKQDGSLALGGTGEAVEWVLRMARVPDGDFLDQIAARGALSAELLDALADAVADYHERLPPVSGINHFAAMRRIAEGNVVSARDAGLPEAGIRLWEERIRTHLQRRQDYLLARAEAGRIRRCHGDLHLGNLCLWQGRIVPFDALEFDEALATIDVGYDLAFLLMDLEHRLGRAAANRVLNRYLARTGDWSLVGGLPVFLSIRAMVRAHVQAKQGLEADASAYLAAALDYLAPPRAVVLAIGGLPGVGKSSLARIIAPELGPAPGAVILRSDEIRKRLHGALPEQPLPPSAYQPAADAAVAEELVRGVLIVAGEGHAAIADATFLNLSLRKRLAEQAKSHGWPWLGVWLTAPLPVLESRIRGRQRDASDADIAVLHRAYASDPGPGDWTVISAEEKETAVASLRSALQGAGLL